MAGGAPRERESERSDDDQAKPRRAPSVGIWSRARLSPFKRALGRFVVRKTQSVVCT